MLKPGLRLYKTALDRAKQEALLADLRDVLREAPLYRPTMPRSGKPLSVQMSNCGALGWVSDVSGYRYQKTHPETGRPWPPMPDSVMRLWRDLSDDPGAPDACLINFYDAQARMGAHQDRDEKDFSAPILSLSLGDSCRFRFGNETRGGPTQTLVLESGDVLVFGGPARKMFHGVDKILPGTSTLLSGRINLTLRRT
jgi:alkylated DNA repair protein (DNA oxidative demethylase)